MLLMLIVLSDNIGWLLNNIGLAQMLLLALMLLNNITCANMTRVL